MQWCVGNVHCNLLRFELNEIDKEFGTMLELYIRSYMPIFYVSLGMDGLHGLVLLYN